VITQLIAVSSKSISTKFEDHATTYSLWCISCLPLPWTFWYLIVLPGLENT